MYDCKVVWGQPFSFNCLVTCIVQFVVLLISTSNYIVQIAPEEVIYYNVIVYAHPINNVVRIPSLYITVCYNCISSYPTLPHCVLVFVASD